MRDHVYSVLYIECPTKSHSLSSVDKLDRFLWRLVSVSVRIPFSRSHRNMASDLEAILAPLRLAVKEQVCIL